MAQVSVPAIAQVVLGGIATAHIDYEAMSGGEWLWAASEYVLTVSAARAIAALPGPKYVTVETNGQWSMDEAGARPRGPKPTKARLRGRFDLLVWWASERPRGVIEIKNQSAGPAVWYADIERIAAVLRMDPERSSLEFGMFGYYFSAIDGTRLTAAARVQRKLGVVYASVNERVGAELRVRAMASDIHVDGDSAWVAGCLVFRRVTVDDR